MLAPYLVSMAEKMLRESRRWVIFWDNASIHTSIATAGLLEVLPGGPIHAIRNLVKRPDLNGIENTWGRAKKKYRAQVDYHKVNGLDFNNMNLVALSLNGISREE